jgi:hypothetical protein
MIWLATGASNLINHYTALLDLCKVLPVDVINSLPVLNGDLTWRVPDREVGSEKLLWKQAMWKRI